MKKNLLTKTLLLAVLMIVVTFSGCVINFESKPEGVLRITNYSNDTVETVIATYHDTLDELYENDVYIGYNEYYELTYADGDYDIYCYMTYNNYDYVWLEEDVVIDGGLTTDIEINVGEWTRVDSNKRASEVLASARK